MIAHADKVLKFAAYSDRKQGLSGHLFVTNFKIAFLTADRSSYEVVRPNRHTRNNAHTHTHVIHIQYVVTTYHTLMHV